MKKYIFIVSFIGFAIHLATYGNEKETLYLPDPEKEIRQEVQVEPLLLIGNVEAFDIDFTPALEALSIASLNETPYYPVLAGSFDGNLARWWQDGRAEEIIGQYHWSKIILQEADIVAREQILNFEEAYFPYLQLIRELKIQPFLLQGGDFTHHDLKSFASREDILLNHYQQISRLTATELIPLAHLMARIQNQYDIRMVDEQGNITIKGAWAAAAITYISLSGTRPANPDFSRLYPDLQELIKPFSVIEVEARFDIISYAWDEWQSYNLFIQK